MSVAQGREITTATIEEVARDLAKVVEPDLFQRMVNGYDSAQTSGLADYVRRQGRAHPFAVAWDELIKGAEKSRESGSIQLSEPAFMLLETLHALAEIHDDPAFPDLLKRLAGKEQYYSTAFEAFVCSAYRTLGVPIALVPEAPEKGERRPDLISTGQAGEAVYLECKSLQDDVRLEERVWSELESTLSTFLGKQKEGLWLTISAERRLEHNDLKPLANAAKALVRSFPASKKATHNGFALSVREAIPFGVMMTLPLNFPQRGGERFWTETEFDPSTQIVKRLWIVESHPWSDVEQGDRLVRLFRDAASQLPTAFGGVVHLQVPYRVASHFLEVVDRAHPQLERELPKRPHVIAVVITGRFLNKRMGFEGHPIETSHAIIPNFAHEKALPGNFYLLGSADGKDALKRAQDVDLSAMPGAEFDVLPEGTFFIQFGINEPLAEQPGRYTFRHCSADGKRQINVWQTYLNTFRIEVVHESFGRREVALDLNHLAVGVDHKMAFSWGADGVRCSVNGAPVVS